MRIVTFYEPLDISRVEPLVDLWVEKWSELGHTPVVLSTCDALNHPRFNQVLEKARKLPTVNMKQFEVFCYIRWCAVAMEQERCAFLDYDVFPRPWFQMPEFDGFVNLDKHGGPGFLIGDKRDWERVIDWLLAKEPDGEAHVSDMTIMKEHGHEFDYLQHLEVNYGVTGIHPWTTAPLVHFGNAYLPPFSDRVEVVKQVMGY